MQLKRGMERESCDFCHGRKIKCDRASRAEAGHETCSQCSLRQLACRLDDSDDVRIRIRKRRQPDASGSRAEPESMRHSNISTSTSTPSSAILIDTSGGDVFARRDPAPLPSPLSLSSCQEAASASLIHEPDTTTPDFAFLENPLELGPDAILFLDQVFMAEPASEATWSLSAAEPPAPLPQQPTDAAQQDIASPNTAQAEPWLNCGLDPATLTDALHAYFNLASLCLPILFEDAFWADYHASRCSASLVFAVACRGMPFTTHPDKWQIQQKLACGFRDAFFKSQRAPATHAPTRLDDLEALALMLGFAYPRAETSLFTHHLEDLFLTHDSLVLMTLRDAAAASRPTPPSSDAAAPSPPPPTRASDRRALLFWHVYGLDAFNNLDYRTTSRIADGDVDVPPGLLRPRNAGYLDAILALAVIARGIAERLCTVAARRHGAKSEDVLALYGQLADWQQNRCPRPLRRPPRPGEGTEAGICVDREDEHRRSGSRSRDELVLQLHRAVVWLLEINCYMQIENSVSEHGIQGSDTLRSEMVPHRVEYESMRAVDEVAEMAEWLGKLRECGEEGQEYSLVDLAPSIVRDICKGLCVWTCFRGKKLLREGELGGGRGSTTTRVVGDRVAGYRRVAGLLRDAVATAVSHVDTEQIVGYLDGQILSLNEVVD